MIKLISDYKPMLLRLFFVILIATALGAAVYYVIQNLFIFVLVIGISAILQKPIQLIVAKMRVNRMMAIIICLLSFMITISISFSLILIYLIDIFNAIVIQIPDYFETIIEFFKQWIYNFTNYTLPNIDFLPTPLNDQLSSQLIKLIDYLYSLVMTISHNLANHFIPFISNAIIQTIELTSSTIIVIILTILLCKDWEKYKYYLTKWLTKKAVNKTSEFSRHFFSMGWGYIKAQLLVCLATTIVLIIGFYFINIDRAFGVGVAFGLIDFIPIIGVGILLWPWIIYCLVTSQFIVAIELAVIYIIIVCLRQFLEPKLVSEQIGMNSFFIISIGYLCILYFGLWGILYTPIVLITIQSIKRSQLDQIVYRYIVNGQLNV